MYIWDLNMPSWLVKPSLNDAKRKAKRGSLIGTMHRKFKGSSEDKKTSKSGRSQRFSNDNRSAKGSAVSESSPPSFEVSHLQSFAGEPYAQPLPLPAVHLRSAGGPDSAIRTASMELRSSTKPHPKRSSAPDWGDLATASFSSESSVDTNDQPDSRLFSPQASDYESGNVTAINSPSRQRERHPLVGQRLLKDVGKPVNLPSNTFRERRPLSAQVTNLQIPSRAGFVSAPHSSRSSPSLSPVGAYSLEQVNKSCVCIGRSCSDVKLGGCRPCSSPATGQISGYDAVGDLSPLWPQSRCSSESSPIPSPRVRSPSCGSHIQTCGSTQLHHRAGGLCNESSLDRNDGGKAQSHKLPLPPKIPGRIDNSTSPVSRWKKGRLIGSGTFGHVYLGFNSDTGEMCAMKEVTLFSDDPKSKESAQQLGQEITLLSHLRHPNIVRYFGSETVDNKLYIYLEYVSGGSIHKLLREYGPFGESAIRSFTHQILSGLAYLHAKNTVHRDIKGANILVDPSGLVKLADFGMAKHITGQSGPLSFKGSPYWMAPEVIRNSDGSNLAVDVWSLGCTVIEMASAKPPWSQYEGVAALFKVGNSKELPAIPDHLSEEGKDFVRKCLQRNPLDRPKANILLEHPFVKNAAAPEKCLLSSQPSESLHTIAKASRYMVTGRGKNVAGLNLGVASQLSRGSQYNTRFSDLSTSKHQSCPVSPIGSPLLCSMSWQTTCTKMAPTSFNPQTTCGSWTPNRGNGAFRGSDLCHSTSGSCTPSNVRDGAFRGSDLYHSTSGSCTPSNGVLRGSDLYLSRSARPHERLYAVKPQYQNS